MKYKSVIATKNGGPEVLQVIENEMRLPRAREARIHVLAAAVCRPDITVRAGKALYSGSLRFEDAMALSPEKADFPASSASPRPAGSIDKHSDET